MTHPFLVPKLTILLVLLAANGAFAQVPEGLNGEWHTTLRLGSDADSTYDVHVMLSPDLLSYTVSGGPSDHANGIACSFGYGATYHVVRRSSTTLTIVQDVDSLRRRIHKPSHTCYRHYQSIGIILPQQITLGLSADGATLTVNDRVRLSRAVSRTPKVWSSLELNGFIDYYRQLMRIY